MLLERVAWRFIVLTPLLQVRCWQRASVKLAVAHQRHLRQQYQVRRHHVIGQMQAKLGLERVTQGKLLCRLGLGLVAGQVANQLLATRHVQGQHRRLVHRRMLQQTRFNFAELDTEAANFHLMIDTPYILHEPISTLAYPVTGAVQAPAISAERVSDKAFGTETWPRMVALSQTGAANIQLADTAQGQQRQISVENVSHAGTHHTPDRHAAGPDW
ncbi:hypothetical protein D3C77_308980 [compost metagenome]